jgi:cytoskeletal protein RodZ
MKKLRQWWLAGVGVTVLVGVIGAGAAMAQTPSTTPTASSTATASSGAGTSGSAAAAPTAAAPSNSSAGKFVPNEDPTHESSESPEREAAEDAGIAPSGPPNGAPMTPGSGQTPSSAN